MSLFRALLCQLCPMWIDSFPSRFKCVLTERCFSQQSQCCCLINMLLSDDEISINSSGILKGRYLPVCVRQPLCSRCLNLQIVLGAGISHFKIVLSFVSSKLLARLTAGSLSCKRQPRDAGARWIISWWICFTSHCDWASGTASHFP